MTHQQILDKLDRGITESVTRDMCRLIGWQMLGKRQPDPVYIGNKFFERWDCALNASPDEVTEAYRNLLTLTITVLFHKYGYAYPNLTRKAIHAVDALNDAVVTSDAFFRQSDNIKSFLQTTPVKLTKRPPEGRSVTFFRQGDVVSVKYDHKYCAAYIHYNYHDNEAPVIEFYDRVFDRQPEYEQLVDAKAWGSAGQISRYCVFHMTDLKDRANQIHLIKACAEPPSNEHLEKTIGHWTGSDIFEIQKIIKAVVTS